jgi:hypothetical protein
MRRPIPRAGMLPWRCEWCEWFNWFGDECRRYAPRPNAEGEAMWPSVARHDYCGEFQPNPQGGYLLAEARRTGEADAD